MQKVLYLVLAGICLSLAVAPSFASGASPGESKLPNETPSDCIPNPSVPTNQDDAEVIGIVSREGRNITINYSLANRNPTGSNLQVQLPYGANRHSVPGFSTSTFGGGLYWENNSTTHSITYEMGSSSIGSHNVNYPSGDDWILAGAPDHFQSNVHLRPETEGFIGGNTLYLGKYTTHRRQAGCQEFVAIVPKAARFTRVEARLTELEAAAESLPVGHQFRTVRIFVSPEPPGEVAGFVMDWQNEIVVVDQAKAQKSSVLWIHEYVHTLQGFEAQPDLYWFYEGSATYLSLRVSVEHGFISPRTYDYLLNQGTREFNTTMTASTHQDVAYRRGAIVLAILDYELARTHDRSVVELLAALNNNQNPGTEDVIRWLQDDVGMDEDDANHTLRLVQDGDVLNPPLIVTGSETPKTHQKIWYHLYLWEIRVMFALVGSSLLAVFASDNWASEDSE